MIMSRGDASHALRVEMCCESEIVWSTSLHHRKVRFPPSRGSQGLCRLGVILPVACLRVRTVEKIKDA